LIRPQSRHHNALNVAWRLCFTGHTSGYGGAFSGRGSIPMLPGEAEMRALLAFSFKQIYSGWLAGI
jgi:hypothetical protein